MTDLTLDIADLPLTIPANKKDTAHLCILSGENINTTKDFSLVVFFWRWELTQGSLREGAGAVRRLRESALL